MQNRKCGDCNLCCKLPYTKFKKDYEWCSNCEIGVGCKIYETRPQVCKDFSCLWQKGMIDEELKKVLKKNIQLNEEQK